MYSYCTTCKVDFLCKHGGLFDCSRHCEAKSHKENVKATEKVVPMKHFFRKENISQTATLEQDVTRAEATMCLLIVESNMPLSAADKFSKALTYVSGFHNCNT